MEKSFVNKIVPKRTISEDTKAIVILDDERLYAKLNDGTLLNLDKWNDVQGTETRYSSIYNDHYPHWTKKVKEQKHNSYPNLVNKFWWRYKPGLILYGERNDNIFIVKRISNE